MNAISHTVVSLPLSVIDVDERLRATDADQVELIADSVRQVGFLTPILVAEKPGERFGLLDGAHRIAVARLLGQISIPAHVSEMTDAQKALAEVDANLCRHELNALDRGAFVIKRGELLKELRAHEKLRKKKGLSDADIMSANAARGRLAAEIADKIGIGERQVYRLLKQTRGLSKTLRDEVVGTPFARRAADLTRLANLGAEDQARVAGLLRDDRGWRSQKLDAVLLRACGTSKPSVTDRERARGLYARFLKLDADGQAELRRLVRETKR